MCLPPRSAGAHDGLNPERMDAVFKALADPTRRMLLDELRSGAKTTTQLVESVGSLSRFGVMKHLKVLEDASLIVVRRDGRTRFNHLNAAPLRMIYERWVSKYEDQWSSRLVALKRAAETGDPNTETQEES